jgi:hypothetical protein
MIPLISILMGLGLVMPVHFAVDLMDLLDRGRQASYGAEQVVTCSTPDGARGTVMTIQQSGAELVIGSDMVEETAVAIGAGGWALWHRDGVVDQANVVGGKIHPGAGYSVVEMGGVPFLGREASLFRLERDGVMRADLTLDDATGVVVRTVTYDSNGDRYCAHRFVSFEPGEQELPIKVVSPEAMSPLPEADTSAYPAEVAGFSLLDRYEDADGVRFTYYSDGFFSFAVFETPAVVPLPDATRFRRGDAEYQRLFTPGQVFYSWEMPSGGMAMVGDLPPDLHDTVLEALPQPERAGLFRRIWRSLFG